MAVIDEIAAERKRQIEVEGYSPEHDDEHTRAELARAAACYALMTSDIGREAIYLHGRWEDVLDLYWPFERDCMKLGGPRRMLVKAAAMLVAEIERLDRLAARPVTDTETGGG